MATPLTTRPPESTPLITESPISAQVPRRGRGPRHPLPVRIVLTLLVLLSIVIFLVPLYWLFSSAFKIETDIYTYPLKWFSWIGSFHPQNFADAWTAVPFGRFFVNSFITTGIGTVLEMFNAILCAYAFAFVRFRWKTPVLMLLLGSLMLPGHVTLLVNYITVGNFGWLNTYQGLILPGIGTAFAMFLLYQSMRGIDHEIIDAAVVDGASHWRRIWLVVVPMVKPMILTATLIVMIGKWNEFVWPLIITSTSNMRTLPIGLTFLLGQEGYTSWGSVMAGTVLISLPMLILFFLAQRRIIGGIAAGALRG